jgi:hypothetical protein
MIVRDTEDTKVTKDTDTLPSFVSSVPFVSLA